MKYTDVIWDFNGTVIDDVAVGIDSVNKLLSDRGLQTIRSKEQYRRVFRFPIKEYYRALGFDFDAEPYEAIAPLWVEEYLKRCSSAPLREGFAQAFDLFRTLGVKQHILSATELSMLKEQLDFYGISDGFDSIYGLGDIHAHSKTELAKKWREENPHSIALFIGDTEHDFDAAEAMGADCALVCGGHQPRETLKKCGAEVYDSITELCELLSKD